MSKSNKLIFNVVVRVSDDLRPFFEAVFAKLMDNNAKQFAPNSRFNNI